MMRPATLPGAAQARLAGGTLRCLSAAGDHVLPTARAPSAAILCTACSCLGCTDVCLPAAGWRCLASNSEIGQHAAGSGQKTPPTRADSACWAELGSGAWWQPWAAAPVGGSHPGGSGLQGAEGMLQPDWRHLRGSGTGGRLGSAWLAFGDPRSPVVRPKLSGSQK